MSDEVFNDDGSLRCNLCRNEPCTCGRQPVRAETMSDDLVERLRWWGTERCGQPDGTLCDEAADEIDSLRAKLAEAARAAEVYMAERDGARAQRDRGIAILSSIYGLLYPPPTTVEGKTYVFRPETVGGDMQRLCEAIRRIPDQLPEAERAKGEPVAWMYESIDRLGNEYTAVTSQKRLIPADVTDLAITPLYTAPQPEPAGVKWSFDDVPRLTMTRTWHCPSCGYSEDRFAPQPGQ